MALSPEQKRLATRQATINQLRGFVREVTPETPIERAYHLVRRARAIATGAGLNPYKRDFRLFLRDCCWTKDEARGGRVAQVPDWPLFDEVADAFITCPLLMIEKARRVLASWVTCCFDVWIAAGGQDPRWPQLMLSDCNRMVIIGSRKLKGLQGSAWFLRSRVKFIVDNFEAMGGREKWPNFPRFRFIEGQAFASNGSEIVAVAQGADQLRGPGATAVHLEELGFWEKAQETVENSLPVCLGGGHVIAITTANAGSYAKRVRDGKLRDAGWN